MHSKVKGVPMMVAFRADGEQPCVQFIRTQEYIRI